jgi:lipid II:glycine glycyltransferase (peptidoglycan interpeptide bridge formation enzyme)
MSAVKFISKRNSTTHAKLPKILDICRALIQTKYSNENLSVFWSKSDANSYWFSRSAESIAFLAELYKEKYKVSKLVVWIPEYFCNDALQFLRKNEVEILYYPVDACGIPNIPKFQNINDQNKPDIFFIVHFFGVPSDSNEIVNFCKKNKSWVVEDATHVFEPNFGIGSVGDFVIYSPHKHFAIPDGAICIARNNGPSELFNDEDFKNLLKNLFKKLVSSEKFMNISTLFWILKRTLQKFGLRYKSGVQAYIEMTFKSSLSEINGGNIAFSTMTRFAKNMLALELKRVDEDRRHRIINMDKWRKFFLNNYSGVTKIVNSNAGIPYLCCVEFDNYSQASSMLKKLQNCGLPVMTWPDLPMEVILLGNKSNANSMRLNRIFLQIHTDITKNIIYFENKYLNNKNKFIVNELVNKNDWDKYWLMVNKKSLTQAWEYGEAKIQTEGWKALRFLLTDEKNIPIGLCQVLTKKICGIFKIARINKGPVVLCDYRFEDVDILSMISAICADLRSRGYWTIQIAPLLGRNPNTIKVLKSLSFRMQKVCPADSAMLDISGGEDYVLSTFSSKWRNSLRKGQKYQYKISQCADQNKLVPILLELYKTHQNDRGYTGLSAQMIKALISNQTEYFKVNIFIAHKYSVFEKEGILGALVSIQYCNISEYLIGITNDEGRMSQANSVLLWHSIVHAINKGCNLFDVGGLNAHTPAGILRFKSGLSGTPYQLIGEWRRWF